MFTVRTLLMEGDVEIFREVRLRALKESPEAFAASFEQEEKLPIENFRALCQISADRPDDFILGAFDDQGLRGVAGFRRDYPAKASHKGYIWGMYVVPEARGKGIGRLLLDEALKRVKSMPGMEQIHLKVVDINEDARMLYQSFGFKRFGIEPRAIKFNGTYLDEEHMWLIL